MHIILACTINMLSSRPSSTLSPSGPIHMVLRDGRGRRIELHVGILVVPTNVAMSVPVPHAYRVWTLLITANSIGLRPQ